MLDLRGWNTTSPSYSTTGVSQRLKCSTAAQCTRYTTTQWVFQQILRHAEAIADRPHQDRCGTVARRPGSPRGRASRAGPRIAASSGRVPWRRLLLQPVPPSPARPVVSATYCRRRENPSLPSSVSMAGLLGYRFAHTSSPATTSWLESGPHEPGSYPPRRGSRTQGRPPATPPRVLVRGNREVSPRDCIASAVVWCFSVFRTGMTGDQFNRFASHVSPLLFTRAPAPITTFVIKRRHSSFGLHRGAGSKIASGGLLRLTITSVAKWVGICRRM